MMEIKIDKLDELINKIDKLINVADGLIEWIELDRAEPESEPKKEPEPKKIVEVVKEPEPKTKLKEHDLIEEVKTETIDLSDLPFHDAKSLGVYCMNLYKKHGREKGMKIQEIIRSMGHENVTCIPFDEYHDFKLRLDELEAA